MPFTIPLLYTYWLGMLLVYLGERVLGSDWPRVAATSLGGFLILAGLTGRWIRLRGSVAQALKVERLQLGLYLVGCFAVLLYFSKLAVGARWPGTGLEVGLGVAWPIVWLAGFIPQLMMKFAYAVVPEVPVEPGKLRTAIRAGAGLVLALVGAAAAIYGGSEWTRALDLRSEAGALFHPPAQRMQAIYFFATVMLVPGLILLCGWVHTRFHGRLRFAKEVDPLLELGDSSRSDTAS